MMPELNMTDLYTGRIAVIKELIQKAVRNKKWTEVAKLKTEQKHLEGRLKEFAKE